MNPEQKLIAFLLMYILVRELMHSYQINQMLNKLMSRDFNDYMYNKNLKNTLNPTTLNGKIPVEDGLAEDLGPINAFGGN